MKALLFIVVLSSASCVSPTAPDKDALYTCATLPRCSYTALYERVCRVEYYTQHSACPAQSIP